MHGSIRHYLTDSNIVGDMRDQPALPTALNGVCTPATKQARRQRRVPGQDRKRTPRSVQH